jgi:hypothetical protein
MKSKRCFPFYPDLHAIQFLFETPKSSITRTYYYLYKNAAAYNPKHKELPAIDLILFTFRTAMAAVNCSRHSRPNHLLPFVPDSFGDNSTASLV